MRKEQNNDLQTMFRMIGFGENLGSGFPLILNAWNEKHWLKPELFEQPELMQVRLVLTVETKDATVNATANATVNATANATVKINNTQSAIVEILRKDDNATYEEISKALGIERTTVWRNIDKLKKMGILERQGEYKKGFWLVKI